MDSWYRSRARRQCEFRAIPWGPGQADGEIAELAASLVLPGWVSFLYLVAFFSLVVRRGGLALSFLVGYFVYSYAYVFIFILGFMGSGSMAGSIILSYVVFLGSALALHFATAAMLRKAASK